MISTRNQRFFILFFGSLALGALFFFRLDALGLTGPDEPRYAQVAKEMYLTNDYVTPRLRGVPWFEKPVLYYWCAAFLYSLGGVTETTARLPSALAALLMIVVMFYAPRKILSFEARFLSSTVLATNLAVLAFSHAASTDMLLTATLSTALLGFFVVLHAPPQKHTAGLLLLAYGALGLSALAKGPVGIFLSSLILSCYFFVTRRWQDARALRLPWGLLIVLAVSSPWYLLCFRANGWTFIQTFFIQHNLERFATNEFRHSRPFWFYLPVAIVGMLPWAFYFVVPLAQTKAFIKSFQERCSSSPQMIFLGLWVSIPFLFFTLAQSKLPGYLLPIFPPLALVLGLSLAPGAEYFPQRTTQILVRWLSLIEWIFLASLLMFHSRLISAFHLPSPSSSGTLWAGGIFALALLAGCIWFDRARSLLAGYHLALMTAWVMLASLFVLPHIDVEFSARPAAHVIKRLSPRPHLIAFKLPRDIRYGLDFYLPIPTEEIDSAEKFSSTTPDPFEFVALPPNEMSAWREAMGGNGDGEEVFTAPRFKVLKLRKPSNSQR